MKAPCVVVLQHHDVPSITRGDHDGVAPLVNVGGSDYRARLLDLTAFPCSVLGETVTTASLSTDAIVRALDVIFGGYPIGLSH